MARRWRLPNLNGGHGKKQWVAGALVEALQGWRGSEGELVLAMATAELRELGGCCCEEERPRQRENRVRLSAGGRWHDEGALERVAAWLGRAEATRGRFFSTRRPRPDGGRPLNQPIQFVSRER